MLGWPVGLMLQSMSASEFATWKALAALEHLEGEVRRKDPTASPGFIHDTVWRIPPDPEDDEQDEDIDLIG